MNEVNQIMSEPIEIPSHTSSIAVICSPTFEEMNKKLLESKTLQNYSFMQIPIGAKTVSQKPCLSPILGSFDYTDSSLSEIIKKELIITPRSSIVSATNELPLTELNLNLFTSDSDISSQMHKDSPISSTNELPLSDIKFNQHDLTPVLDDRGIIERQNLPQRSFSNPNILEKAGVEPDKKSLKLVELSALDEPEMKPPYFPPIDSPSFPLTQEPLVSLTSPQRSFSQPCHLSPVETECYPFSFYPHDNKKHASLNAPPSRSASHPSELSASVCNDTSTPTDLSLSNDHSHKMLPPSRSLSHPSDLTPHSSPALSPNHVPPPVLTNPSAVNPESACASVRRHRHGIAGHMSYIKMLGFGFGGPLGLKKLASGSSNSLFSTAVISGSSSAPNLRDMIPSTASASAIEGFGGVPPIRPLETLHNALSLRQLDFFLDKMTSAQLFRTPASSPPKYPSTPLPTPTQSQTPLTTSNTTQSTHPPPLRLQSPSNSLGWSGPPSFVSSSGPSSPTGMSDLCSRESSDMSASIISSDGCSMNVGAISQIFPTIPGLDQDLGSVGILLENDTPGDSMEIAEFYSPTTGRLHTLQVLAGDSGEITPVSGCSEVDCNTNDATAGSTADADVTMTEDFDASEDDGMAGQTTPLPDASAATPQLIGSGDTSSSGVCVDTKLHPGNVSSDTLAKNKNNAKEPLTLERLSAYSLDPSVSVLSLSIASPDSTGLNILSNNLNSACSKIDFATHMHHLKHIENAERIQNASLPSTSSSRSQFDVEGNLQKSFGRLSSSSNSYQRSPSMSDPNRNSLPDARVPSGIFDKDYSESSKNISALGSDKWSTNKEKFLDSAKVSENKLTNKSNQYNLMNEVFDKKLASDLAKNLNVDEVKAKCEKSISNELQVPKIGGAVLVKESFIEPPRMTRISKSFHGKTSNSSSLNVASGPRRASDSVTSQSQGAPLKNVFPNASGAGKGKSVNVNVHRQLSQPATGSASVVPLGRKASLGPGAASRFTTTLVDEAEHAAQHSDIPALTLAAADTSSVTHGFHLHDTHSDP